MLGVAHEVPRRGLADLDVGEVQNGAKGGPAGPGGNGGGELAVGLFGPGHVEAPLDLLNGGRGDGDLGKSVIQVAATLLTEPVIERAAFLGGHLSRGVRRTTGALGLEDEAGQQSGQLRRFELLEDPAGD